MFPALQRFFEAAGCRTQTDLAKFLDISQSSISDAKRREVIPAEWLLKLLRNRGVQSRLDSDRGGRALSAVGGTGRIRFSG